MVKSPEELMAFAKEYSVDLTEKEANTYLAHLNTKSGEVGDDELEDVAGGRKCGTIYKDDMPVVVGSNSCDHYQPKNGNLTGCCSSCKYFDSTTYFIPYVCTCPERRNN